MFLWQTALYQRYLFLVSFLCFMIKWYDEYK